MFLPPRCGSFEANAVQEAYELVELANECIEKGEYDEAIDHYVKAVPVLRDVDDEYVLRCEYCLGICYTYLGQIDDAILMFLKIEAQNQQCDRMIMSEPEVADLFQRLSRLYLVKWKKLRREDSTALEADMCVEDAKTYLTKYLRLCQSGGGGGDLSRQLDAFRRFAALFYSMGDYQSACLYYNNASKIAERLHMEPTQLHCSTCIANSLVALGRLSEAIDTYKATLDFAMKISSDKAIQAQCTYRLGCALLLCHRYSDAILYFLAHERIASDLGDLEGRLHSLDRLITAYREIGDYAEANKYTTHKELLIANRSESSNTHDFTGYSYDHTLRSNISTVEQPSQLSGMNILPGTDSYDNLLISRTFDSGQGVSNPEAENFPEPLSPPPPPPLSSEITEVSASHRPESGAIAQRSHSFAFIDEASVASPVQPVATCTAQENKENCDNDHELKVPLSPSPPLYSDSHTKERIPEEAPPVSEPQILSSGPQQPVDVKNELVEVATSNSVSSGKNNKPLKIVVTNDKNRTHEIIKAGKAKPRKLPENDYAKPSKPKRRAPTLPPEEPDFFDLLTRATTRRLDDQRAQLKPLRTVKDEPTEAAPLCKSKIASSENDVEAEKYQISETTAELRPVTKREPVKTATDDLFLLVANAQSRRLDDQRAVLRPLPVAAFNLKPIMNSVTKSQTFSPDIKLLKSGGFLTSSEVKEKFKVNTISVPFAESPGKQSTKSSKARRFLSQLMK